ncbi:hypothetical protein ABZ259_20145 [Streptomyces cyaneofuscatus]
MSVKRTSSREPARWPPSWKYSSRTATPGSGSPPWPSTTTTSAPRPRSRTSRKAAFQTVLSGRSLIGLLIKLWDTRHTTTPLEADWALATTAYNRIAAELTAVDGEGQTIRIVLDDGLPHETSD